MKYIPTLCLSLFITDVLYTVLYEPEKDTAFMILAVVLFIGWFYISLLNGLSTCTREDDRLTYEEVKKAERTCQCGLPKLPDMIHCDWCAQEERKRFVENNPVDQWDGKRAYFEKYYNM